ncbi:AsmA family protein [Rhodanobacter fulvus]|uniref:AsmA family protein n=1 Tax=Rhodanobacter fulvus TaxID=219571 RepID=UPI00059005D0|nr:AsmA family protein [Rhodanobacter fulvus]
MSPRLRRILAIVGATALAALLLLAGSVYFLLQPDRFTAMLQNQAANAGLELNLSRPASPSLFPRPALDLHGITINAQGANRPILLASGGRLALPWRTLLGGPTVITRLEINSPRVDLDALQAWINALPARGQDTPPDIPRIDTGVSIDHGSVVRGDQLLLGNLSLEAGSLASGVPFPLSVSANTADGMPLQLRLSATPRIQGNALQLENIALYLSQGAATHMQLAGSARWHGAADAAASLTGTLDHATAGQYAISLALTPADQSKPLLLSLKLDGPDNHADLRLPPLALARWWGHVGSGDNTQLTVPPGSGHADIAKIDMGGITIEGLTLRAGDEVPATASAAAPASPAPVQGKKPAVSR